MAIEFAQIIGSLAESLLGEPNRAMSKPGELRYGARGSLSVDLTKGTWFDHEANEGGGALDLVTRETHLTGQARLDWLKEHGFLYETITSNGSGRTAQRPVIVAAYDYTDEHGEPLFQVCRFDPKDFRQRRKARPDDPPDLVKGEWFWSIKGVRFVPYRLHDLLQNDDRIVCIVEGEKDADRLWKMGVPATTNPGGAGKWREELNEFFQGADVVIIPDYDPQKLHPKTKAPMFHPDGRPVLPGQDHGQAVAASLQKVATRVRVLELWKHWPEMPLKGDVSDWIKNGGTAEQLYALIDKTPVWSSRTKTRSIVLSRPLPIRGEEIPRRPWIVPPLLLRRQVTVIVAPPGSGKSLLTLQISLMTANGERWGSWSPRGQFRTLVINAEEDYDEMCRRLYVACCEMKIDQSKERDRIMIAAAEASANIIIAKADARTKTVVRTPMVDELVDTVKEEHIDVLVVDPFAETFEGDENSNSELKWAAALWREIARRTNCAVLLVHHTRKQGAEAGDMNAARGGGALAAVARIVCTIFPMREEEADAFGVPKEERHRYVRFDDAKANLSLVTGKARWFKKNTVTLPNAGPGPFEPADEVGVLEPWAPEGIFHRTTNETFNAILDAIALGVLDSEGKPSGDYFTASRRGGGKRWAGHVIRELVECTPEEAQKVIDVWIASGLLIEMDMEMPTSKGVKRKCLRVVDAKRPGTLISEETM